MSRPNLNLLAVFDAIYTHGGVTRASEVLHLTQPAVSHALARLREWIDDPLFVRNGQQLTPTPIAHRLIAPIRAALQSIEATLADLAAFDPSSAKITFTLGVHPLMEDTFFLPLVAMIQKMAPSIAISSVQFDRRNLEADLASGVLNAAIDVFLPLPETVYKKHISSAQTVVIVREGHPRIKGTIDLDTYLSLDHVLVSSRRSGHGPEDIALAREGLKRTVAIRCQHITTAMCLISSSDLVLTMSEVFARRANGMFDHQIVRPPFSTPPIDTYLFWHANGDAEPANQWLRQMIENVCHSLTLNAT